METRDTTLDVTIRGGLINVPLATKSIQGDRHQPNTPANKKTVAQKPDHRIYEPPPIDGPQENPHEQKPEPTDEIPEELE